MWSSKLRRKSALGFIGIALGNLVLIMLGLLGWIVVVPLFIVTSAVGIVLGWPWLREIALQSPILLRSPFKSFPLLPAVEGRGEPGHKKRAPPSAALLERILPSLTTGQYNFLCKFAAEGPSRLSFSQRMTEDVAELIDSGFIESLTGAPLGTQVFDLTAEGRKVVEKHCVDDACGDTR